MSKKNQPIVAERVEKERLLNGYARRELARVIEVDDATLFHIESGDTESPGLKVLEKLADVFGCSLDYLAGRVDRIEETVPFGKGKKKSAKSAA